MLNTAQCGDLFAGNETCCESSLIMTKNSFNHPINYKNPFDSTCSVIEENILV